MKKLTKDFHLNFVWKQNSIKNIILPKLKPKTDPTLKSSLVYHLKCDCEKADYIGETVRPLTTRVKEHARASCGSEVFNHIKNCQIYQSKAKQFLGKDFPHSSTYSYLINKFSVLKQNVPKYSVRCTVESLFISLLRPNLNKQTNYVKKLTVI